MKKLICVLALASLCSAGFAQTKPAAAAPKAEAKPKAAEQAKPQAAADEQGTLYSIGYLIGQGLDVFSLTPAEFKQVQEGIADSAQGKKAKLEVDSYRPKIEAFAEKRNAIKAEAEKKKGLAYAEKAAKEKNAVKLASGIVIIPVAEGTGAYPLATDMVKVNYTGSFIDGKVFDSSVKRGEPAVFGLNGVIPCWSEGMQKVKVGGKAKFVCPASAAYGDNGRPPRIPGGATLVFDIELLDIVKPQAAAPAAAPDQPAK